MTAPIVRIMFVNSVKLDSEVTYATSAQYVFTERDNGVVNVAPLPGRARWVDSVGEGANRKAVEYTVDVYPSGIRWVSRAFVLEPAAVIEPEPTPKRRRVPAEGGVM